jgi:DNA-binding LytR/AlgR family response regulator
MVTLDGEIFFYGSINKVYSELKKHQFFFIHKSFLVNYCHVVEFKPKEIRLSNSSVLPIGQQRRKEVMELQIKLQKEEE